MAVFSYHWWFCGNTCIEHQAIPYGLLTRCIDNHFCYLSSRFGQKTPCLKNRSYHGYICRTFGARSGTDPSWPMAHHQQYQSLLSQRVYQIYTIFMQVLDLPFLRFPFELDGFEHASIFLHLAIFAGFTLSAELSRSSEILSVVSGIFVASVFGQEVFLLHFHSADHVGLEGHYHWLLQLIVLISLLASLTVTFLPSSLSAALVLSVSVVFQGCWFMNMGFMLWCPKFIPRGCIMQAKMRSDSMHGAVTCYSHEADFRARALANMQFSWILSAILIFTGFTCLKFAGKCTPRAQSTEYEQLEIRTSDVPITIDTFKS
ncbi:hypothetical protein Gotri_015571 [Gossypium trilobum]|uniref:Transmembrane protein 45B n=1 Tax=Gossypium trilobum TaxID=34281 RepID=A0A7J9E0K6_9ROSI|nr:hypothetical protein [Gossypium trilobum]